MKRFFALFVYMCVWCINFSQTKIIKYTYDSQNRIKTALFPNGNSETYYYDKVGNRISQINVINTPTAAQNNISLFEEFKIFPNPTDGLFNLTGKIDLEIEFTLILYDNTGKQVQSYSIPRTKNFNQEFNIKDLPSGSYHLTLSSNNGSRTWTIIKI